MKTHRLALYRGLAGLVGGSLWLLNHKQVLPVLAGSTFGEDDPGGQDVVPIRGGRFKLLRRYRW